LLSPLARARLFITPERLTLWESQDPSKDRPLSEINSLLERGNEDEVKAYLALLERGDDNEIKTYLASLTS
jgi:hypothetical protein